MHRTLIRHTLNRPHIRPLLASCPPRCSFSMSFTPSSSPGSSSSSFADGQPRLKNLPDSILLSGLTVRMLVGVDNWERVKQQPVTIDVRVHTDVSQAGSSDHLPYSIHYGTLTKELEAHCASERYRSLEALADGLAKVCIFVCKAPRVTLRVQKPRSLLHAHSAGVQISRSASDYLTPRDENAETIYAPATKANTKSISVEQLSSLRLSPNSTSAIKDRVFVKDLCISTILGVNPWERVDKQVVKINFEVYSGLERLRQASMLNGKSLAVPAPSVDVVTRPQNYRTIVRSITKYVEGSSYKTVESLATSIAKVAIGENRVERIRVRVDKPSAIMFADAAGVEVDRDRDFFERDKQTLGDPLQESISSSFVGKTATDGNWHVAAIALGSNVGDRFSNIEKAVKALSEAAECKLVDTSFLYETAPMYVTDQGRFINGACRIATTLSPHQLLKLCQSIEKAIGRDKRGVPIKGPRSIDLDIIFYDRLELNTPDLVIPHPGIIEREFVLKPLIDILPDYRHPSNSRTVSQLHSILVNSEGYIKEDMGRVMSLQSQSTSSATSPLWKWGSRTFVMGIINATPDSFSDGGDNIDASNAVQTARQMVKEGADVIDIGGMSTAPNAVEITEEEEIARVVPVIQAIRKAGMTIPISIDTFRAKIAQAAIIAGANMINDVSAGVRDPSMFSTARDLQCPIILMHMRGDSKTMNGLTHYDGGDVVGVVRRELEARLEAALREGIRRWNIILDPGIGFAKDMKSNLKLLRGLALLQSPANGASAIHDSLSRSSSPPPLSVAGEEADENTPSLDSLAPNYSLRSFPVLLGASRKKFLGALTGKTNAKDRMASTAAACTAGIMAGVDLIRVHDVKEMVDVAKTADAISR
jgi:dihydroneopterin aldolase/2-amino-4-hydroxy-6-hydroxymethyldihydropteridine diphosphokinase/dihydropteroate synthase